MKRFFTAIAILLSFVWTVSAQTQVYLKTDTTLQQKGDYNDVYPKSVIRKTFFLFVMLLLFLQQKLNVMQYN